MKNGGSFQFAMVNYHVGYVIFRGFENPLPNGMINLESAHEASEYLSTIMKISPFKL